MKLNLDRVSWNCVHFVEGPAKLGSSLDASTVIRVEIGAASEDELLSALAEAFGFPYFGHNWDALADVLRDLSWLDGRGYVLVLDDAKPFWEASPRVAGTLVEIWLTCAEYWASRGVPFHLVFGV